MDDYSALAQRISVSVSGVSGALILSRDGLVLGASPNEERARRVAQACNSASPTGASWSSRIAGLRPAARTPPRHSGARTRRACIDQMEQALLIAGGGRLGATRCVRLERAPSGKPRTPPSAGGQAVGRVTAARSRTRPGYVPDRRGFSEDPAEGRPRDDLPLRRSRTRCRVAVDLKKKPQKLAGKGGGSASTRT
jgi:hypothetical protein